MEIFYNDKFYDNITCDLCYRNTYYSNSRYYCINCKRICYTRFKKVDNRSRITIKNNCKMQHFKQILNELVSYNISDIVREMFDQYIQDNNITADNINICIVENFIKNYVTAQSKTDNMLKYQLLNKVLYNREKPTMQEIEDACEVFQTFILFIQEQESNFTMKYDFYVMKIFKYLNIEYNFSKREFKDNTKKNKDNCYWNKFLKYGYKEYYYKKKISIPEDDKDF